MDRLFYVPLEGVLARPKYRPLPPLVGSAGKRSFEKSALTSGVSATLATQADFGRFAGVTIDRRVDAARFGGIVVFRGRMQKLNLCG